MERESEILVVKLDYSKGTVHLDLNELDRTALLRGLLVVKDYQRQDMIVPFVTALIDHATGMQQRCPMTQAHTT